MNKAGPDSKCIWPEDRERVIRKLFALLDDLQGAQYGAVITTTIRPKAPDKRNSHDHEACRSPMRS